MAVVCERCVLTTEEGHKVFKYGAIPPQVDVSSFRCFFDDPQNIRLRDYRIISEGSSKRVMMGVDTMDDNPHQCTIVYQTGGFVWNVWYDCILSEERATLSAWIAISNETPLTYHNVELRFVCESPSGDKYEQRLFTTERPVSIAGSDVSHIELITVPDIPVLSRLIAPAESDGVYEDLYIRNSEQYGLGMDLPTGPIRIYENRPWPIHTDSGNFPMASVGDDISLRNFKVDDVSLSGGWNYDTGVADLYIKNDRTNTIVLQVEELESRADIVESSHQMIDDASLHYFPVTVQPGSTGHLKYRVSAEALLRGRPPGYGMQTSPVVSMQPVGSHLPRQQIT